MARERLTIGALSRRTGVPVKTLRFYSDEGLLPPSERSRSGYRLYAEQDVVRIDLIRTLREAGLGLQTIRAVLRRDVSLGGALRLRLTAVEAQIRALQQVAAALRAALRSEPTEQDIRRLCAVTQLSNEERRATIERFFERVSDGIPIDQQWLRGMIEASAPKLPDEPTPAQLDAWIELAGILSDPTFVENMRAAAADTWSGGFDLVAYQRANQEAARAARDASERGVAPSSAEAAPVVEGFVSGLAAASGKPADAAFRASLLDRFSTHDPRASRYWELVAIMKGEAAAAGRAPEWDWLVEAIKHHLRAT
ncbi:MerR family transcriptional regulator [Sorangium sp. So ce1335]|uniref:helix-turn-helix domain-containing protein n=1 Tax=Sorangium sp. So ce1335 TaxID=3133335 RepID=UPI003F5FD7CC